MDACGPGRHVIDYLKVACWQGRFGYLIINIILSLYYRYFTLKAFNWLGLTTKLLVGLTNKWDFEV